MNDTTYWNLSDVFGIDGSKWIGRIIELKVEQFRIEGRNLTGIIGEPAK